MRGARKFVALILILATAAGFMVWSPVNTPALAFGLRAAFIDSDPSPALAPGATTKYSLRFRNVGLVAWQRGTDKQVTLGVQGDVATYAEADTGIAVAWLSPTRIATTTEQLVLPGGVGTFTFSVRAPDAPGTYRVPVRLVVEGVKWLDHEPVAIEMTSDLGFHGSLVEHSGHLTLRPGETSPLLTVRFRNTGAKPWVKGTVGQQLNLGVAGDDKSFGTVGVGWPAPDRVAVQTEPSVGPGGIATFTFRVRAPAVPGTYALRLRPVVDGVAWLEDEGLVTLIRVVTSAAAADAVDQPVATADKVSLGLPSFTLGASVTPGRATRGSSVAITANLTAVAPGSALIGIEVSAPGGATIVYQKWFHNENFAKGEQRAYPVTWAVAQGAVVGDYGVKVSAYSAGWKTLYDAKPSAATVAIVDAPSPTPAPTAVTATPPAGSVPTPTGAATAPPTGTPTATSAPSVAPAPTPSFSTNASVAPAYVAPGASLTITAAVTSGTSTNALVDIEIWAVGSVAAAYQVWFDNQSFAANQTRPYSATWQVPAATALGTYRLAVGVYSPGWATRYIWTDSAATFSVTAPAPSPSATQTVAPTPAPTATALATNPPAPSPLTYPGDPIGGFDGPAPGASVGGTGPIWGWAIDRNASGSAAGVDRVVLYRDGLPGVGTLLGTATYGELRPDVGSYFGNIRWNNSGWHLDWTVGVLSAGTHTLYAEMRSTITGATTIMTQSVTVPGTATPPPPPAGGVAAPAQPPAAYTVPAGVTVTNSAGLSSALAAGTPQNIILASGVYDNGGPFQNGNGHHLYSATLGGAVLTAGLVIGGNSGGGGSVQGLAFDVSDSSKTLLNSIIHVWGTGGRGTHILDTTFSGHNSVGIAIMVRQPEGLVVQRVRVRDFRVDGILVDANVQNMIVTTPVLLEDIDVANVSYAVPKSSNGTAEACIWLGNTGTVRRAHLRNCAWMGLWTGTADAGSLHEDLDIDTSPVAVYIEHFTTASTFQRMDIGPSVTTGVVCEWADPGWGSRPACVDNVIQDSTIASSRIGVVLDEGTTRTTVRRVKFIGQAVSGILDYRGINNTYSGNDYSGIAPGAVPVSH